MAAETRPPSSTAVTKLPSYDPHEVNNVFNIHEKKSIGVPTEYRELTTLSGHTSYVFSVIQLSDGRIASGSYDNTIKVMMLIVCWYR